METVSKSRDHRKVLNSEELATAASAMASGVSATGRRVQNRLYALRAMERLGLLDDSQLRQVLVDRPALRWLVDEEGARWGILTELGRIKNPEKFHVMVGWVLKCRPKTKEAVRRIRHFRTGRSKPPDARELSEEVVRAINRYGLRHPELTHEQELEALRLATETLADGRPPRR